MQDFVHQQYLCLQVYVCPFRSGKISTPWHWPGRPKKNELLFEAANSQSLTTQQVLTGCVPPLRDLLWLYHLHPWLLDAFNFWKKNAPSSRKATQIQQSSDWTQKPQNHLDETSLKIANLSNPSLLGICLPQHLSLNSSLWPWSDQ